ncbi:hypothetical protein [Fibrella forsythiae]|uniref:Uncharacterized protein n=1 Tax=Fibrella forsythiae TaxID=2817061 RepID=A0ABS3JMF0_9BACT|nr:hypothetical protein [Fibrella forsythiae]MBO0951185.1 hypothetical protein [Fibrella forsythiae]
MPVLAIIDSNESGEITILHHLGECNPEEYFGIMGNLTQAQDDWDIFCNTILATLQSTGILQADGFSAAGHTYNDVFRAIRDYFTEAQLAAKNGKKLAGYGSQLGKFDEFLLSFEGTMIVMAIKGLAKIGKPGQDIVINKEQAEAVFWALLEPTRRQLMRDPERHRQIQPILDRYFGPPDYALDA